MAESIERHQLEFQVVKTHAVSVSMHDRRPETIVWEAHPRTGIPNLVGAHNQ